MEEAIKYITENWDKIPEKFKKDIRSERYDYEKHKYTTEGSPLVPNLSEEDHYVVLLLDRQKPSVEADYSFDEERIGISKNGVIIWGFDSGCSCPSPWDDGYPSCYNHDRTYKEFVLKPHDFDPGWENACLITLESIKRHVI